MDEGDLLRKGSRGTLLDKTSSLKDPGDPIRGPVIKALADDLFDPGPQDRRFSFDLVASDLFDPRRYCRGFYFELRSDDLFDIERRRRRLVPVEPACSAEYSRLTIVLKEEAAGLEHTPVNGQDCRH